MSNVGNADAFIPLTLYIMGFKGCIPFHHYSFIITNYSLNNLCGIEPHKLLFIKQITYKFREIFG